MDKKKILILGGALIVTGVAVFLFLKKKKNKTNVQGKSEPTNQLLTNSSIVPQNSPSVQAKIVQDVKDLAEARAISEIIAKENRIKAGFKRSSSRANVDREIEKLTAQMAKLGYKPLADGGVAKI